MDEKQMSIRELETYFRGAQLPSQPFQLHEWLRVNDAKFFVDSHINPLRGKDHPLDLLHQPLYLRLLELKQYLEKTDQA